MAKQMLNKDLIAQLEAALAILKTLPPDMEVKGRSGVGDDSGIYGTLLEVSVEAPDYDGDECVLNALVRDENDEDGDEGEEEDEDE